MQRRKPVSKPLDTARYSTPLWFLSALVALSACYVARQPLGAVAFSLLLYVLLEPAVRQLARLRVPRFASASACVLLLVSVLAAGFIVVAEPLADTAASLPKNFSGLREDIEDLRRPLEEVSETADLIEELSTMPEEPVQVVEVRQPPWVIRALESATSITAYAGVSVFLAILLLAQKPPLIGSLAAGFLPASRLRRAKVIASRLEGEIGRYFRTVAVINAGLGLLIGFVFSVAGFTNPWMWGLLAFAANFVPYVGPLLLTLAIWMVGIVEAGSIYTGSVPALVYFTITLMEGQLVTPSVLGRRLAVNPALIFFTVMILGWLWGVIGAVIAVPLLLAIQISVARRSGVRCRKGRRALRRSKTASAPRPASRPADV